MRSRPRFFSLLNLPRSHRSESGTRFVDTYSDIYDDEGVACVEITGKQDLQEYIQSFKSDTDIYEIMKRLSLSGGEIPASPSTAFMDLRFLPDNIHDAFKSVQKAKEIFNSLDVEHKKIYHNSFTEFMSDFGSQKFNSIFQSPVPVEPTVEEMKGGESNA